MKLQATSYTLWWEATPYVVIYQPAKNEDCSCLGENLRAQQPKSLLERSLFLLAGSHEEFADSASLKKPVLREWYGILPSCTPFKHLLRLAKLTGWEGVDENGKPIVPFRLNGMSHEIHCLYHPKRDSQNLRLLFRMQIGAPDGIAIQLGEKIASEMKKLSSDKGHLLLRPKLESYKTDRWAEFASIHLENLLKISEK